MNYNTTQGNQGKDCDCKDQPDTSIQKDTINPFREEYCREVYDLKGKVAELEVRRKSLESLIGQKQCWFVYSERHYRIYRNLSLMVGSELSQTGDSIKEGVKTYMGTNKLLADALKKLGKSVKDAKDKTQELRTAACKLRDCKDDICNCSQIIELTGDIPNNCEGTGPTKPRPTQCKDVKEVLKDLIHMPSRLSFDIDSIFKSTLDVTGIQTFSNITTLDPLQTELSDRIKKFDKQVQDTTKQSETDLKTATDELLKSKKDMAKTVVELYSKRSDFEGVKDAVSYFCCTGCGCVIDKCDAERRLENCEKDICNICKQVQGTPQPEPAKAYS